MNYQDKTKEELFNDLLDLQQKYDTISLLYETEKTTLAALVENNSDVMLVKDCNRRIIAGNSAFLFASGYNSLAEIIGKTDADILNISENSEPVFSYMQEDLKALQLSAGEIIQREENIPIQNGELKTFLTTKFPIFINHKLIGIGVITSDITDLKNAEQVLKQQIDEYATLNEEYKTTIDELQKVKEQTEESEAKFKNLVWDMSVGVLLQGSKAEMLLSNPKALELLGINEDQLLGKTSFDPDWNVIHEDGSPFPGNTHPVPVAIATCKPVKNVIMGVYHPVNKERVWLMVDAIPQNNINGTVQQVVCTFIDITEKVNAEKELIKAKEKAEESDQLKTAFLQNMSHEIRTPLNAISGFSGMLNKPELSEEKRKSFVSIIQNSSHQLISIVTDILTISSVETKQEKCNINKVCINNIIVDLLAIFKQKATNQNISLYAKQQLNDKQSEIFTDKTKITQILSNLISNALKFTHEGFIEFGYNLKDNELEFYVKDSGIGIKPEFHDKIFERFRQADKSINKLYGGTGLGLAISKAFVNLLDGKIWVQSELEKGATFFFTIPYNPVNEIDKTTTPTKQNENFRTVLVAEDEEYNFLFIEELLIDMDLKLIHSKDGKETVEICKTNPNIDLILMDIKMPIMDGQVASKLIKEFRPDLPIIAQSAYALEHERDKYSGKEFDDYITKPIKEEELKQKVMKYINKQENIHLSND